MLGDLKTSGNRRTVPQYFPFNFISIVSETVRFSFALKGYCAVDQSRLFSPSQSFEDSFISTSGETSIMYSLRLFAFRPHPISRSGIR